MPGRTPQEAYEAFEGPLRLALSCLGPCKILTSPGGRQVTQAAGRTRTHAWYLNGVDGRLELSAGSGRSKRTFQLAAMMRYRIIANELDDGSQDGFRITTRGYKYTVYAGDTREIISYHWHPQGNSPWKSPHMHNGSAILAPDGVITPKSHLPTGRISLEQVVRVIINDLQVPAARPTWDADLATTEGVFAIYRKWHSSPPATILAEPADI